MTKKRVKEIGNLIKVEIKRHQVVAGHRVVVSTEHGFSQARASASSDRRATDALVARPSEE